MIKVYGLPTCPYCDYIYEQIKDRTDEFEYINIGSHVRNMGQPMPAPSKTTRRGRKAAEAKACQTSTAAG